MSAQGIGTDKSIGAVAPESIGSGAKCIGTRTAKSRVGTGSATRVRDAAKRVGTDAHGGTVNGD